MSLSLLALISVTGAFVRRQAAQETSRTPPATLIEKGRVYAPLVTQPVMPAALPAESPDEHEAGLPRSFASAASAFERSYVKNAPFSATLVIETVEPRQDGTSAARRLTSVIHRDAEGRARRDRMAEQSDTRPTGGDKLERSVIRDPVAGLIYVLEHRAKVARRTLLDASPSPHSEEQAWLNNDASPGESGAPTLTALEPRGAPGRGARPRNEGSVAPPSETKRELLGEREVEGVLAEGTRLTRVIPAGALGNNQPIEIVAERWYSPDLQAVVLIKRNDPRYGESVYRLTGIKRGEPARSLFEVPSSYKVK